MKTQILTTIILACLSTNLVACETELTEAELAQLDEDDSEEILPRDLCVPQWELLSSAAIPCHMDVDTHWFGREVEAYGADVYEDVNSCENQTAYFKRRIDKNKCTWNISTWICALELWDSITGSDVMPNHVYDKDACPHPRLSSSEIGGPGGGPNPGPGTNIEK